jgi:hypothetical protein
MAGGGARPGVVHGETDDFSYNIVRDPVHIHDFHATCSTCSALTTSAFPSSTRVWTRNSPASNPPKLSRR